MSRPQGIVIVGVSLGDEAPQVARAGLRVARALRRRAELVHAYTPLRHLLRAEGEASDLQSWTRVHERLHRRLVALGEQLDADPKQSGWHVEDGRPYEVLNEVASSLDADLIVVGIGSRETLERGGMGSTVDRLLRTATRPILVLRPRLEIPPRRVLVATDLSRPSAEAYRAGQLLLDQFEGGEQARIELLTVLDPAELQQPEDATSLDASTLTELGRIAERYGKRPAEGLELRVRHGDTKREILAELDAEEIDLVVVGTHGRSGVRRLLLGSVASELVRRSPASVLVVPPAAGHVAATTIDAPAVEPLTHRADFGEA